MALHPEFILHEANQPRTPIQTPVQTEAKYLGLKDLQRKDQEGQMSLDAKKKALAEQEQIKAIFQQGLSPEETLKAIQRINPATAQAMQKALDEHGASTADARKKNTDADKDIQDWAGSLFAGIDPNDPAAFDGALNLLKSRDPSFPYDQVRQTAQTPEDRAVIRDSIMKQSPKQRELGQKDTDLKQKADEANKAKKLDEFNNKAGKRVLSMQQPDGSITYEEGPEVGAAPRTPVPGTDTPLPPDVEAQRKRISDAGRAPEGPAVELTPAGMDAAALNFIKTGQLPPMGNGKDGARVRSRIINRAAEMTPGLDIASNKADYGANKASLDQLVKQKNAVETFENTTLKNMQPLLASAKKLIDTGSPLINLPLRQAAARLAGSPDQAVFNAALQIVTTESAKIITNPNLSGQLSDSARHEVESLIPESATLKQVVAVLNLLKTDFGNRRTSIDEQIKGIRERIKDGPNEPAGAVTVTDTTGKVYTFPNKAQADGFKKARGIQ